MAGQNNRSQPSGMAWIFGNQKPFYNPRKIRRGQHQGMIEVEYLAKAEVYRKTIICPKDITDTNARAQKLARQLNFDDFLKK
jgi:hypothetical protein